MPPAAVERLEHARIAFDGVNRGAPGDRQGEGSASRKQVGDLTRGFDGPVDSSAQGGFAFCRCLQKGAGRRHDPDAPLVKPGTYGFVHWVLYGIPGDVSELPEGVADYVQGVNDFGNPGYGGPMPPPGHGTHHYFYWLLALDVDADLPAGLTMWELLEKLEPNIIGMNRLVGTYSRT